MKKIISIAFLVVLLVTVGLILGPGLVDWNKYRPEIVSRLQAATGHEYAIMGNIEFAIVPMPRMEIENLKIGMPETLGGETIASLGKASVNVELMPLLQKRIVVKNVELVKPVFHLGVRADGSAIWMTPELQKRMDAGKAVPSQPKRDVGNAINQAVSLDEVRIREGSFTYNDERKGKKLELNHIDLDVQADSLSGPYKVSGQMNYQGQPVKIAVKSGKISETGSATPVQAELSNATTTMAYSGVIATQPSFELQGETRIKSFNLSEGLKAFTAADYPALAKPVDLSGILTFRDDSLEYKNVALNVAGTEVGGNLALKNLKKETGKPMDLILSVRADKPVKLDSLLSPSKKGNKSPSIIPETISLPASMRARADITAKTVEYKGATFNDVDFSATLGEKDITGALEAVTPGQGKINTDFKLTAGSISRAKEGVVLGDLSLGIEGSAQAAVPQALIKPFIPADALKGVGSLLTTPASTAYKVNILPGEINLTAANINILDTELALSGSYVPGKAEKRDLIKLNASAPALDADAWLKRMQSSAQGASTPEMAQKEGKPFDLAGIAKKLTLPLDIDASVLVGTLTWHGETYDKVAFKGRVIGNKLTIDSASLQATGGNSLMAAGTVGDVSALKNVDLTLQAKISNTEKTLQDFKIDIQNMPREIGPSEILAEFKGQPDNLSFVANVKAMKGTLETSGILDDVMAAPKISNLTARIKHPNYVELARIFNPGFKSNIAINKNLDVYASLNRQGTVYTLKDLQATIGPSTLTGDVTYDAGTAKPRLAANLSAGDLALSDIVGYEAKSKGVVQAKTPSANSENVRWSRNAINAAWMRKYDADIKITAKSLTWVNWRMDSAVIEAGLDKGVLNLSRLSGGMYGGTMNANATITAPADDRAPLGVAATAKLSSVSLEPFVSSFSGARLVKARGTINLDTSIETSGVSPAALIFGLKGKGTSTGKDLVFEGFDLARISRTLAQPSSSMKENIVSLLDTSMTGGQTAFETLDGAFTINEGVIDFDKLVLTGTAATVNTTGKINLPLWTMDLENTVKLAEPADAPPLKTSFRGPLDNPGKTLGRSALESYVGSRIEKAIGGALIDKLQDKGLMEKSPAGVTPPQNAGEVIQNLIQQKIAPKEPPVPAAPAPAPTVTPESATPPAAASPESAAPPPSEADAAEEALKGLIEGLMDQ